MAGSCKKDFNPGANLNDELVVLAEITAGEPMKVPVSKSIQVGDGGIINFDKVKSAIVTITRQDGKSWNLNLNNSADFASDPASVYTSNQRPRNSTMYSLKVQDPLYGTVTAQAWVPARVNISHFDTSTATFLGTPVLKCRFTITDPPDSSNLYIFEGVKQVVKSRRTFVWQGKTYDLDQPAGKNLYDQVKGQPGVVLKHDTVQTNNFTRLTLYTEDNSVDNAQFSSLDSGFRRIFLPGKTFGGRPYIFTIYIDRKYFVSSDPANRGRVLFQVKSVSAAYYNYLFWYEKYKSDVGTIPPGQLYSPPGNIQNGLGIFGGCSKFEKGYYFDAIQ